MTALKAMVAAGNYPTPSQMLGYTVPRLCGGRLSWATDRTAKEKEGLDKSVPAALQKFSVYDGKWVAAPVNVHSVNWLWIKQGGDGQDRRHRAEDLRRLRRPADKAKAAGVIPLAPRRPELAGSHHVRFGRAVDRRT